MPSSRRLLGRGVEADGLIGVVADRKWHLGIGGTTTPKTMSGEQLGYPRAIRQIGLHEREARVGAKEFETRFFELRIVIGVEIVEADDVTPVAQEAARDMKADEAGRARDQYCLIR